jgi:electron transport complex protein RnfB
MEVITAILVLGGLGLLFGAGLAFAAKRLCLAEDPRLEKIYAQLPGANCGACGKAGCMGFAESLINGQCSIEKCVLAQEKARQTVASILGVELKKQIKRVAVLHCNGGRKVKQRFIYKGIQDCVAANLRPKRVHLRLYRIWQLC